MGAAHMAPPIREGACSSMLIQPPRAARGGLPQDGLPGREGPKCVLCFAPRLPNRWRVYPHCRRRKVPAGSSPHEFAIPERCCIKQGKKEALKRRKKYSSEYGRARCGSLACHVGVRCHRKAPGASLWTWTRLIGQHHLLHRV